MRQPRRLFIALNRRPLKWVIPDRLYYWLLDQRWLGGRGDGWRPLHMRYPEHFPRKGPWRPASWYEQQSKRPL